MKNDISASAFRDGDCRGTAGMNRLTVLKLNLASLYGLFRLARNTDATRYVFMIGNAQDSLAEDSRRRAEMRDPYQDSALERLWQERYCPVRYNLDELLALGSETLGGFYARHMKARGLRPDFYEDVEPTHKLHFLRLRMRQTHDIWHTLSGFDTDPIGEVGLQGFYFGQFTNGQSALIVAGAILKSIVRRRYGELEKFVETFCEGFHNGRSARPLLGVKWEQFWEEPLEDVRRRFAIERARAS
jgi:ubiquinone biosynthesis protein COQ4